MSSSHLSIYSTLCSTIKEMVEASKDRSAFGSVAFYGGALYSLEKVILSLYDCGSITHEQCSELIAKAYVIFPS
jgi:hypothetical protein